MIKHLKHSFILTYHTFSHGKRLTICFIWMPSICFLKSILMLSNTVKILFDLSVLLIYLYRPWYHIGICISYFSDYIYRYVDCYYILPPIKFSEKHWLEQSHVDHVYSIHSKLSLHDLFILGSKWLPVTADDSQISLLTKFNKKGFGLIRKTLLGVT